MFQDKESAKEWLKKNAPLKYVDGAWLGHVHKITTPFALRSVIKNAWQVLSEELGDGELEKNHTYLYKTLLQDIGIGLPENYTAEFIRPEHKMDNEGVWKAATAQLLISLFPNKFLPEILGFNLHYELVTLDTLKASKELPHLGISGYYFSLHIAIDNADSGHTAMALATVDQYMKWASNTRSIDPHETWKRIQAGYVLSATVGNQAPLQLAEERVINILQRKASASHRIHCTSKFQIGRQSLAEWLAPQPRGTGRSWGRDLLIALADAKPWVYRGNSRKSLLMRELSWKGKLFGAFTYTEVEEIREWIDSLQTTSDIQQLYWKAVERRLPLPDPPVFANRNAACDHPVFPPEPERPSLLEGSSGRFIPSRPLRILKVRMTEFLCLWFTHPCLLENMVNTPYRAASVVGSYTVRLLRAEYGFSPETSGVAGLDEHSPRDYYPSLVTLGLGIVRQQELLEPTCIQDVLENTEGGGSSHAARFANDMLSWPMRPHRHWIFLLGLARALLDLE
ncbi:hypothetical protein BBP40_008732 [Aspergillus hancockii]|nr:hypothetical protein BBP40_008732 [Aspergillus hancockii]